MFIFKIVGVCLIIASSTYIGFLNSKSLVERRRKLLLLLDGVNTLYNHIEQGEFELEIAIKNAFCKCNFLTFGNEKIVCDDNDLKKDKFLVNDFFMRLGRSTKKVECDHINLFITKIKIHIFI